MAITDDVKRAFLALNGKLSSYNTLFSYADGKQPLVYSTERLREAFRNIDAHFQQNWCSVVINAVLERLTVQGWNSEDKSVKDVLDTIWKDNNLQLDAEDVHFSALVTSEAFIIAWPKEEGGGIEIYENDPRMCQMFYDPAHPKEKQFAGKWWNDAVWHLDLYYADRIEHWVTRGKNKPSSPSSFEPDLLPQETNTFGVIPVFHFKAGRQGEIDNIKSLQDAINKLLADMMIAAEFGAFPQRYVISDSDTKALKNSPAEIWTIPPTGDGTQPASVGQFQATPLDNYLNTIDKLANSIAIISRTPKHYFYNAGASLSGEALLAMEAPLNKKAKKRQENLSVAWQELGAFLAKLSGKGDVLPSSLTVVWSPVESVQPLTEAMVITQETAAGIPLKIALKRRGWGADEIAEMEKEAAREKKANVAMAPLLLDAARAKSDNSNNPPVNGGQNNPNNSGVNNGND